MKKLLSAPVLFLVAIVFAAFFLISQFYVYAPDVGQPGGPIAGLTPSQLRKFYETKKIFLKEFTPEEGLGPLFNGKSCFECHGQPGLAGGEGRDVVSTGVIRVATWSTASPLKDKPLKEVIDKIGLNDIDLLAYGGGPAIQRKSITSEFADKYPRGCQQEIERIPPEATFTSMRHAGPLFGFGLIEAIPDPAIMENVFEQLRESPEMAGRAMAQFNRLTEQVRVGRFGWKCQQPNLINFTIEALNAEMGITTDADAHENSEKGPALTPPCLVKYLPPVPNDSGKITAELSYFQALLAPPPRGEINEQVLRGEKLFEKLKCAVCHKPQMWTAPQVFVIDPDSPAPKFNYLEIEALENKPVRAYSDFLVHNMGPELADGVPQSGAVSGQWRTTPLWGLRHKEFYLHDGRTKDLSEAVLAHGGQAAAPAEEFKKLPASEKADLLAFLRSL